MCSKIEPLLCSLRHRCTHCKSSNMIAHHVAAIYRKDQNQPLIFGQNNVRGNSVSYHQNIHHAERDAMERLVAFFRSKKIKMDKSKLNLIVVRMKNGKFANSRPCYFCSLAIHQSPLRIKNILYSTDDGDIISESIKSLLDLNKIHISMAFLDYSVTYFRKYLDLDVQVLNKDTLIVKPLLKK